MLVELSVQNLGVIESTRLLLGPGMTALTGETGAGKTMLVEALDLLVGGRSEPALVRSGATEAVVEGRFVVGDDEHVLTRVVPASGRSRAYVDGRMATIAALGEHGEALVDLHGQHAHQSLLAVAEQRRALDRFAGVDLAPLRSARARAAELARALADLGGDAGARAREVDLLRFQQAELEAAALSDVDEDERLDAREAELADAAAHRQAAAAAVDLLTGAEPGSPSAADALAGALAILAGRAPFVDEESRLRALAAEVADLAAELRGRGEAIEEDPEALAQVRERRQLLVDLRRKYGSAGADGGRHGGTLADVVAYLDEVRDRLDALEHHAERAAALEAEHDAALAAERSAATAVAAARRAAAPELAAAVQAHLVDLAMPRARLAVEVAGDGPADQVQLLLAANPGVEPMPLAKVASGGELARTMLALRLVLTAAPPTLVFDEVDAGIGGEAALSVGRALAALAARSQVLVVTHLPQVAAYADAQISVVKRQARKATTAEAVAVEGTDRVVELSRMLSGQPDSESARAHAAELLEAAQGDRGSDRGAA